MGIVCITDIPKAHLLNLYMRYSCTLKQFSATFIFKTYYLLYTIVYKYYVDDDDWRCCFKDEYDILLNFTVFSFSPAHIHTAVLLYQGPGEYFFRPMLKEYTFDPATQVSQWK